MTQVRRLRAHDVDAVVARILRQIARDASRHHLVNAVVDEALLRDTMLRATNATWVALRDDEVIGHLFGAVLRSSRRPSAWTGPDGVSFDESEALASLLDHATTSWRAQGVDRHYVWAPSNDDDMAPWRACSYTPYSVRGVMKLMAPETTSSTTTMPLRRAKSADLDALLALDHVIDLAQGERRSTRRIRRSTRHDIRRLLDDPDVDYYVVDQGGVVAQAITYPAPSRRGSFEHTLHLSGVAVLPGWQGRGLARAMLDAILRDATSRGARYVEAQWRVENERANNFWPTFGLVPTYVQLTRRLGK